MDRQHLLPLNHKTVFVFDHGPALAASSNYEIKVQDLLKSRQNEKQKAFSIGDQKASTASISKSLWTVSLEAVCEYCRLVWDIFQCETNNPKLFRFIASGSECKSLNISWDPKEQNLVKLMKELATLKAPKCDSESGSVLSGILEAVQLLQQPTLQQKELQKGYKNKGRIIVITHIENDMSQKNLVKQVSNMINKLNNCKDKRTLSLDFVELLFVHVKSDKMNSVVQEQPMYQVDKSQVLHVEVHDVKAFKHGISICNRMLNLVRSNYDLSATSITGIPMKEEQNASSSFNYDVVLLHKRLPGIPHIPFNWEKADDELERTITLRWRSPKVSYDYLYHCIGAAAISPVEVVSRPTVCLVNFLLTGRCVMLEQVSGKSASINDSESSYTHIINSKGGSIYLHALFDNKHKDLFKFDKPTSLINNICQLQSNIKLKSDLRTKDFDSMVRRLTLHPLGGIRSISHSISNLQEAFSMISQDTRYWPLYQSKCCIQLLAPELKDIISKRVLDEDEVNSIKKTLVEFVNKQDRGETLQVQISGHGMGRGKRMYKEYDYKELWEELDILFRAHALVSSKHEHLLKILFKIKNKEEVTFNNINIESNRKRKKLTDNPVVHIGVEESESPESPPSSPQSKIMKTEDNAVTNTKSILQIIREKQESQAMHLHVEFHGRLVDPVRCHLYPDIDQEKPFVKPDERNGSNRHNSRASNGGQQNRNNSHKNRYNGNRSNHQHRNSHGSNNHRPNEMVNSNASVNQNHIRKSAISFSVQSKKTPILNKHSAMLSQQD